MDTKLVRKRLMDIRRTLPEPYLSAFKYGCKFIPEKRLLISSNNRYGLVLVEDPPAFLNGVNIMSVKLLIGEEVWQYKQ